MQWPGYQLPGKVDGIIWDVCKFRMFVPCWPWILLHSCPWRLAILGLRASIWGFPWLNIFYFSIFFCCRLGCSTFLLLLQLLTIVVFVHASQTAGCHWGQQFATMVSEEFVEVYKHQAWNPVFHVNRRPIWRGTNHVKLGLSTSWLGQTQIQHLIYNSKYTI